MRDNDFIDAFDIAEHLIIPEPQHAKILTFQPCGSRTVLVGSVGMLTAIDLDDEPPGEADKVDDIRSNRYLAAKAMAADLFESELRPKASFGLGWIAPQLARAR